MGRGIDYGMGTTNIDKDKGIRYGVIPQNEVLQAWADSSEADYGSPTCGKCGNEAVDIDAEGVPDIGSYQGDDWDLDGRDHACLHCKRTFDSDDAYGDEPECWYVDDGEYQATCGNDGDIFITKSPYYTRAAFCSPCAPGACYLLNPREDGEKAYCFSHDWFEDGKAPYPVYRVSDDTLVEPE
jgi:hypothetical protein